MQVCTLLASHFRPFCSRAYILVRLVLRYLAASPHFPTPSGCVTHIVGIDPEVLAKLTARRDELLKETVDSNGKKRNLREYKKLLKQEGVHPDSDVYRNTVKEWTNAVHRGKTKKVRTNDHVCMFQLTCVCVCVYVFWYVCAYTCVGAGVFLSYDTQVQPNECICVWIFPSIARMTYSSVHFE